MAEPEEVAKVIYDGDDNQWIVTSLPDEAGFSTTLGTFYTLEMAREFCDYLERKGK